MLSERGVSVRPRVVVIGGGLGGLETIKRLRDEPVSLKLINETRHEFHGFLATAANS